MFYTIWEEKVPSVLEVLYEYEEVSFLLLMEQNCLRNVVWTYDVCILIPVPWVLVLWFIVYIMHTLLYINFSMVAMTFEL